MVYRLARGRAALRRGLDFRTAGCGDFWRSLASCWHRHFLRAHQMPVMQEDAYPDRREVLALPTLRSGF